MRPNEWLNFLFIAVPSSLVPLLTVKLTQKKNTTDTWQGLYMEMKNQRDEYKSLYEKLKVENEELKNEIK